MSASRRDMLLSKLEVEHAALLDQLKSSLRSLALAVKSAQADMDAGRRLNAHLIHNHAMLTETIARWNQLLDIMPYIEEDKS